MNPTESALRTVVVNLIALILLGVSICAWFLFFTDLFPQVVGLLGLGGLFAWIAFLSNLLADNRKKELQCKFDEHVLSRVRTLVVVTLLAMAFFLGIAPMRGALVVSTLRDGEDRTITFKSLGPDENWNTVGFEEMSLAPHTEHVYSLPTPWFGYRRYQVKVLGLPARVVEINGWHRRSLSVPSELPFGPQPILLLHLTPEANIMVQPPEHPGKLRLFREGKLVEELSRYLGENVWIGGEPDIGVPEWMRTRWRLALSRDGIGADHLDRWEPSRSLGAKLKLHPGMALEFRFVLPSEEVLRQRVIVAPPYPQEVSIDVPH